MSGGRFDYADSRLKSEIFGWAEKPANVFEDKEISELVWDLLDLIHAFDWYASGDTGKDAYLKEKAKFKKKWLATDEARVRRIIEDTFNAAKQEIYETYGLKEEN